MTPCETTVEGDEKEGFRESNRESIFLEYIDGGKTIKNRVQGAGAPRRRTLKFMASFGWVTRRPYGQARAQAHFAETQRAHGLGLPAPEVVGFGQRSARSHECV